jgi:metal-sulfur cluster biosynthetic enzyme
MLAPLRERVLAAIDSIQDPCSLAQAVPVGLSEMGLVTGVELGEPGDDGRRDVALTLRVTAPGCMYVPFMDRSIRAAVGELEEVGEITTDWDPDAEWSLSDISGPAQERIAAARERRLARARERKSAAARERRPATAAH